jgi:hypothetical protein
VSSVQTLQYADLPARWGVSCERTPSVFRIAVEPSGWHSISTGYIVALSVLLFFTIAPLVVSLLTGHFEWPGILSGAVLYMVPVLVITVFLWRRFRQRILFVVTADTFTITTMGTSPRAHVISLPRNEVGQVKMNAYSGQLTLQHLGKDLLDFYVSPNGEVVEFVAAQLSDALAHPPTERAGQPFAPPPPTPTSRWRRPAALVASLLMFVIAVVLLFVVDEIVAKPIGAYMLLLSPVPVGIVLGTQPKKFWV